MNLSACINMRYAQIHEKGVENVSQLITELLASRQNSAPKKKPRSSVGSIYLTVGRKDVYYQVWKPGFPLELGVYKLPGAQQKKLSKRGVGDPFLIFNFGTWVVAIFSGRIFWPQFMPINAEFLEWRERGSDFVAQNCPIHLGSYHSCR